MRDQDSAGDRAAWLGVLDELRRALPAPTPAALVERAATDTTSAWRPPVGLGQLPSTLVGSARALLEAQDKAIEQLRQQQRGLLRHLEALRSVPSATDGTRSIYLDTTG